MIKTINSSIAAQSEIIDAIMNSGFMIELTVASQCDVEISGDEDDIENLECLLSDQELEFTIRVIK